MAFSTKVRRALNRALAPLNLQVQTLVEDRNEKARLAQLKVAGHFDRPVYPLPMDRPDLGPIVKAWKAYQADFARLPVIPNKFCETPDIEILYSLTRALKPKRIVEIGSGHSTRIFRHAINDGKLTTQLVAIDPFPRYEVEGQADVVIKKRFEEVEIDLDPGDFLFIDSSHEVRTGSDVAKVFCQVLPRLKPGVIVHVHDIFLPFEYPYERLKLMGPWGEQYLLHAFLQGRRTEILWPGLYVQRLMPEARKDLPFLDIGTAQAFWFKL